MPNTILCQYGDALGSPERIDSCAERLPLPLDADRLPPGAPKARPFRAVALSTLCTALLAGWYASGTVLFAAERYEAPRFSRNRSSFLPVSSRGLTIGSTSGC
jgi:hypothetical protein